MSGKPYSLDISPETELVFNLSTQDATPRCTMTLRHKGLTDEFIAFKVNKNEDYSTHSTYNTNITRFVVQVKTTQPRRYLVRPNQGLIGPRDSESVSILLVEKDKQTLLQSFERLGQTALDQCKDKFLVQSCAVSQNFSNKYTQEKKSSANNTQLYDALTSMWSAVSATGSTTPVVNAKLHVRHTVGPTTGTSIIPATAALASASNSNMANMTQEQLIAELASLRRKYDELVSFSVNLTAERDILNNTLEQTKRDLNREMANRAALENKSGGMLRSSAKTNTSTSVNSSSSSLLSILVQLLAIGIAAYCAGVRMAAQQQVDFLINLPLVGKYFAGAETE